MPTLHLFGRAKPLPTKVEFWHGIKPALPQSRVASIFLEALKKRLYNAIHNAN